MLQRIVFKRPVDVNPGIGYSDRLDGIKTLFFSLNKCSLCSNQISCDSILYILNTVKLKQYSDANSLTGFLKWPFFHLTSHVTH